MKPPTPPPQFMLHKTFGAPKGATLDVNGASYIR